jgi:hypothetical protein
MNITNFKTYIFITIILFSCAGEAIPPVFKVDKDLETYLNKFKLEAEARGVKLDLSNLILEFTDEPLGEKCGECLLKIKDPQFQKTVKISRQADCWKNAAPETKESLVFHELGHCLLGRTAHRDDLLPNELPASIMSTFQNDQYAPCVYDLDGNNNCIRVKLREYYINELFNPKTPVPDLAK